MKRRGILSLLLAITMVSILTASMSLMAQRIRITQRVSQQTTVSQQAFQAAYTGIENWIFQLKNADSNSAGFEDIPSGAGEFWKCTESGSTIAKGATCPTLDTTRYRVVFTDNTSVSGTPSVLRSTGQKLYKRNLVTRALEVEF